MVNERDDHEAKASKRATKHAETTASGAPAPSPAAESAQKKSGDSGSPEHAGYRVLERLAKGGMGQVSLAEDRSLKRRVVIKEIREKLAEDQDARRRFVAEARITGQLEHPGIIPVYALGVDRQGRPFYAMRRVQGETLKEAIDKHHAQPSPTSLREVLRRFVAVCQAVAFAHARGAVHRDLKPANVMLGEFGETFVLDWGLAKAITEGASPESTIGDLAQQVLDGSVEQTLPGAKLGSPPYMCPEQAEGKAFAVGPAADIYGLGAILYDILTGQPPYSGESSAEVIQKVRSEPPPKPSQVSPRVPRPLEAICVKAMARAPEDRYASVLTLARDVQNWLDDEPVSVHTESRLDRGWRWVRQHRTGAISSVVLLLSLFAAVAIGTLISQGERVRRAAAEALAEDHARRAEEAEKKAEEKEQEAAGKAEDAAQARAEAIAALKQYAQAEQEKASLHAQIAQLGADIKIKAAQTMQLETELESLRAELPAVEKRARDQLEEARLAKQAAEKLEQQAAELRQEALQLRLQAREERLRATSGDSSQPSKQTDDDASQQTRSKENLVDLTEDNAQLFDCDAADESLCLLSDDDSRRVAGRCSLRVQTLSSADAWVTYPANRSAGWDLSGHTHIRLAVFVDDAARDRLKTLRIRLGRGSSHFEFRPIGALDGQSDSGWLEIRVPLTGGVQWARTTSNRPDLASIDWLEIHAAAKTGGTTWIDNLGFELGLAQGEEFELDREAAEWVLSIGGRLAVFVGREAHEVRDKSQLPEQPFKLNQIYLEHTKLVDDAAMERIKSLEHLYGLQVAGAAITDVGLRHVVEIESLVMLFVWGTQITDEGLKELKRLPKIKFLNIGGTRVTDKGLAHLKELSGLRVLHFSYPKAIDGIPKQLGGLTQLQQLDLHGAHVRDADLKHFGELHNLSELNLQKTRVTEAGVTVLQAALPNCKILWDGNEETLPSQPDKPAP